MLGVIKSIAALIIRWFFYDLRSIWLCLAVISVALLSITYLGPTERAIRITGLALQLAGIVTVAWGILATRSFFGLPPVRQIVRAWWQRRPCRKLHHVSAGGSVGYTDASAEGGGYATYAIDPESSLPEALRVIQQNLDLVHQRVSEIHSELTECYRALQKLVNQHTDRIGKVQEELSLHVKRFGTGSLHISAIGAVWLFIGAVLGTASQELHTLLK